jgi:hypothetical protein
MPQEAGGTGGRKTTRRFDKTSGKWITETEGRELDKSVMDKERLQGGAGATDLAALSRKQKPAAEEEEEYWDEGSQSVKKRKKKISGNQAAEALSKR